MTTFWREGHWRAGPSGLTHWVDGHWVARETWEDREWNSWVRGTWTPGRLVDGVPNSRCPICEEPVWFYRNPNGGCAYFDDLGWPWPKHPCMDSRTVLDRTAAWQAREAYRSALALLEPDEVLESVRPAYDRSVAAREAVSARDWLWEVEEAESSVREAMDRVIHVAGKRLTTIQRNRERWTAAKELLAAVNREYMEAQELFEVTQAEYLRMLNEHQI